MSTFHGEPFPGAFSTSSRWSGPKYQPKIPEPMLVAWPEDDPYCGDSLADHDGQHALEHSVDQEVKGG